MAFLKTPRRVNLSGRDISTLHCFSLSIWVNNLKGRVPKYIRGVSLGLVLKRLK